MRRTIIAACTLAVALVGASLSVPAAEQTTIFNTKDFRKDRALWATPDYYRFNTAGQLGGMALNIVPYEDSGQVGSSRLYGSKGSAKPGATKLDSPYPFKTAMEQYNAWLKEAKGGTKYTRANVPDWSGLWGGAGGGGGGGGPPSDLMKYLQPKYQEYYVQSLKASAEGRSWGAGSMCLPGGYFGSLGAEEFYVTADKVVTLSSGNGSNTVRWIYVNQPHTPENLQFPKWNGESIAFWNGDTLVVHTNQIRGWKGGPGGEYTDDLETVEKYRRVGDMIQGEITIYDPAVFTKPVYQKMNFRLNKAAKITDRPLLNTCTDSNGPAPAVYLDKNGLLNQHIPGEAGMEWDPADPRPWGTWYNTSDTRYKAYLARGGKPLVQADVTPTEKAARPD